MKDVLNDIIHLVEKPSNGEMLASILFVSEEGGRLLEGAAPSLPKAYNYSIHGIKIGDGVGSCGTAAFTKEPVYVADMATDRLWAAYKELALSHDLKACWSVPIKDAEGNVIGTFANYYKERRAHRTRHGNHFDGGAYRSSGWNGYNPSAPAYTAAEVHKERTAYRM